MFLTIVTKVIEIHVKANELPAEADFARNLRMVSCARFEAHKFSKLERELMKNEE